MHDVAVRTANFTEPVPAPTVRGESGLSTADGALGAVHEAHERH
jgi:hypothetical protein